MTTTVDIPRLIAALRDTAEKAVSMEKVKYKATRMQQYGLEEEYEAEAHNDKYSRDWVAGRLHGMADTLEAMTNTTPAGE